MDKFIWEDGKSGFITANGLKLEAACYGPSPNEAATIVLLHEGLGCVTLWRDFPKKLAEATGLGVFAYSRAGYGKSDLCNLPRPLDYQTLEAMDVVPEVLDAVGFQSGILLGHSDGATMAAIYGGMSNDKRVRGIVLMAPHFFTEPKGLAAIAEAKTRFETGDLRQKMALYHADVDCAFKGWNDAWLDPGFVDWNVGEVIDYLRIPVLAIQGEEDEYGTLAQIEELENRTYCPLDKLILKDCGHSPHIEKPSKTLASISEFTTRLQRLEAVEVEVS